MVNHLAIVRESGLKPFEYPYFEPTTKRLAYNDMINCLSKVKFNSFYLKAFLRISGYMVKESGLYISYVDLKLLKIES